MKFSLQEQIRGVEREVRYRERVYPRLIDAGKLTQRNADYQVALMKDVLETLTTIGAEQADMFNKG